MNDLQRDRAPFSTRAWEEIDDEARRVVKPMLAARRLVEFTGPLGWNTSAIDLGRTKPLASPERGIDARLRQSQSLVELRVPFELSREELEAIDRGAKDADLGPVGEAARRLALAEDRIVFHGYPEAGINGIVDAAEAEALTITEDYRSYPGVVAEAINVLRNAGVDGPYSIALGPRCYEGLTATTSEAGYPVLNHVRRLLDGPIVWAPAVDGAVVMSLRGEDFEMTVGRDISIGYHEHTARSVALYLQESLTFRVLSPEAAVPLRYAERTVTKE